VTAVGRNVMQQRAGMQNYITPHGIYRYVSSNHKSLDHMLSDHMLSDHMLSDHMLSGHMASNHVALDHVASVHTANHMSDHLLSVVRQLVSRPDSATIPPYPPPATCRLRCLHLAPRHPPLAHTPAALLRCRPRRPPAMFARRPSPVFTYRWPADYSA
jgi:hypothetical protein